MFLCRSTIAAGEGGVRVIRELATAEPIRWSWTKTDDTANKLHPAAWRSLYGNSRG